ncbi:hypothetical protein PSOS111911_06685 [Pseudoalteromonas ostreae]
MKAIERNVADAGVYQHFYHIATRRLFFPQESFSVLLITYTQVSFLYYSWANSKKLSYEFV